MFFFNHHHIGHSIILCPNSSNFVSILKVIMPINYIEIYNTIVVLIPFIDIDSPYQPKMWIAYKWPLIFTLSNSHFYQTECYIFQFPNQPFFILNDIFSYCKELACLRLFNDSDQCGQFSFSCFLVI